MGQLLQQNPWVLFLLILWVAPWKGWALWKACVAGDPKAWRAMKRYNCLTPDHKVLNTNLNWIEIGKLNIGDTILGFDVSMYCFRLSPTLLARSDPESGREKVNVLPI